MNAGHAVATRRAAAPLRLREAGTVFAPIPSIPAPGL